jgi:hypothetical protein
MYENEVPQESQLKRNRKFMPKEEAMKTGNFN